MPLAFTPDYAQNSPGTSFQKALSALGYINEVTTQNQQLQNQSKLLDAQLAGMALQQHVEQNQLDFNQKYQGPEAQSRIDLNQAQTGEANARSLGYSMDAMVKPFEIGQRISLQQSDIQKNQALADEETQRAQNMRDKAAQDAEDIKNFDANAVDYGKALLLQQNPNADTGVVEQAARAGRPALTNFIAQTQIGNRQLEVQNSAKTALATRVSKDRIISQLTPYILHGDPSDPATRGIVQNLTHQLGDQDWIDVGDKFAAAGPKVNNQDARLQTNMALIAKLTGPDSSDYDKVIAGQIAAKVIGLDKAPDQPLGLTKDAEGKDVISGGTPDVAKLVKAAGDFISLRGAGKARGAGASSQPATQASDTTASITGSKRVRRTIASPVTVGLKNGGFIKAGDPITVIDNELDTKDLAPGTPYYYTPLQKMLVKN